LVLDTFEEVQYRSQEFVRELWSFLEELQTVIPRLRTVLSGRVAVELSGVEVVPLKLEDLDVRSAEEVLHAQGLARPVAARLAAFLGGNPLSLRLVFQYLHQEFKGKRADEITVDDLRLDEIQRHDAYGYLFGRILDHIHDERVKQLAHPGLVLRRVTPALIREVLAKPCNLTLESNADAEELFAKLSREVALVATEEGGDALRHRPDVRRVMLDRLRVTEPSKVRDIHQRAVAYYEQLPEGSVVARAEEIYHRLSLERQLEEVDARWRDDLRAYFPVDSIEELPMSAQLYLAARFDFDLPHLRWAEARLEDWERHAERRARDLLRRGEPQKALAVLGARTDRSSSSPLLLLQAEAHEQLGQTEAALRAGDAVVNSAAVPHSTRDAYDQTLEAARQAERLGDLRLAEERLAAAAQLAGSLDDPARQLEVLVRRLSFVRRRQDTAPNAPADPEVVCQLQDEAAALFAENAWKDILSTSLLHALAAEVGGTKPPLLKQIMAQASLPEPVTPEQTHALIEVLSGWEERLLEEAGGEPFPLARAAGLPLAGTSAETWKRLADDAGPATLASVVSSLLVSYALDTETAVGIAGFLQRSVTSAEGTALSQ
ncbi:MAG TPA: hypothetical protein VK689_22050, partial [Armatimonadota bacterium]|nr:hypothetical protein [Armatimonadota bacterium]